MLFVNHFNLFVTVCWVKLVFFIYVMPCLFSLCFLVATLAPFTDPALTWRKGLVIHIYMYEPKGSNRKVTISLET